MALLSSNVTKNINKNQKLWRYMPLDKFIDLLSKKKLFFAPIASYIESDPFEGLFPRFILDKVKNFDLEIQRNLLDNFQGIKNNFFQNRSNVPSDIAQQMDIKFRELDCKNRDLTSEKLFFDVFKSVVVNCWHQNDYESEAMWKIYSENLNGIAIQTTAERLTESISDPRVFFSEIKYIDFYNNDLKIEDCIFNGNLAPVLKRKAFEHEKEARLYLTPQRDPLVIEMDTYKSESVDVDLSILISKIYISPYAKEPYINSVRTIAKVFGIKDEDVIQSELLNSDKNLTKIH